MNLPPNAELKNPRVHRVTAEQLAAASRMREYWAARHLGAAARMATHRLDEGNQQAQSQTGRLSSAAGKATVDTPGSNGRQAGSSISPTPMAQTVRSQGGLLAASVDVPAPAPDVVPLPPSPHPVPPPVPVPPEVIEPPMPGKNEPIRDPIVPTDRHYMV